MSTATGHLAEAAAAEYLEALGYRLLDKNWRSKWCEIDLIVQKDNSVYFIEVKYRRQSAQGGGLEHITAKKLRQMEFAANLWVSVNGWEGDMLLSAIELSGQPPEVTEFIPELT